jgi:hypothetical protein
MFNPTIRHVGNTWRSVNTFFNLQYQIQKIRRMVYLLLSIPAPGDKPIVCIFHVILKILSQIIFPLQKGERRLYLQKVSQ